MRLRYIVPTVAAAVLFGAAIYGAAWYARVVSMPPIPAVELDRFPSSVRDAVRPAYEAVRAHPYDAQANGRLGMLLHAHKQNLTAAACYRRARALDPRAFEWVYYLGVVEAAEGRNDDAVATLRQAVARRPAYLPAQLRLGETLLASGRTDEADTIFERAVKQHPESADAYYGLGRVQAARRQWTEAAASYARACELFPPYGPAHYGLGLAYRNLHNEEASRRELALYEKDKTTTPPGDDELLRAVQALDVSPSSLVQQGAALERAGQLEQAAIAHERALEADPNFVQAHVNLISLYARLHQPDKAEMQFRQAVALNPNNAEAYFNYGVLAAQQGRFADAEQAFRKAIEINPAHAGAHDNFGALLERRGRLDEAVVEFRKALENQPDSRFANFHLGRILVNRGQYQQAIAHLQKTITPDDAGAVLCLYALGSAYGRAGNREAAVRYDQMARERAARMGQQQLVADIDRDLRVLQRRK